MRKEIRIMEVLNVISGQKSFRIIKQTYRGNKFGTNSYRFMASNGIELASDGSPAWYDTENILCVKGCHAPSDDNVMACSIEDFVKIQGAIAEYNKLFGASSISNISIANRRKENLKNPREEVLF